MAQKLDSTRNLGRIRVVALGSVGRVEGGSQCALARSGLQSRDRAGRDGRRVIAGCRSGWVVKQAGPGVQMVGARAARRGAAVTVATPARVILFGRQDVWMEGSWGEDAAVCSCEVQQLGKRTGETASEFESLWFPIRPSVGVHSCSRTEIRVISPSGLLDER